MRTIALVAACSIALVSCNADTAETETSAETAATDPVSETEGAAEFEEVELSGAEAGAAKACHDEVWLNTDAYKDLPNAAVSIVPNLTEAGGTYTVPWTVEWDDPAVNASGTCAVANGEVTITTN